jgi:hypothetical protein
MQLPWPLAQFFSSSELQPIRSAKNTRKSIHFHLFTRTVLNTEGLTIAASLIFNHDHKAHICLSYACVEVLLCDVVSRGFLSRKNLQSGFPRP